jgi:hypothetical protein
MPNPAPMHMSPLWKGQTQACPRSWRPANRGLTGQQGQQKDERETLPIDMISSWPPLVIRPEGCALPQQE